MRVYIIILIILKFTTISCHAQKMTMVKDSEVPMLIENKHQKIAIKDKSISDSTRVSFVVVIRFIYPLKDTTKMVQISSVEISQLTTTSSKDNKKITTYSSSNKKMSAYQKYIWNLCNSKFQYWYRNQPYETMIGRNQWGKLAVFGGALYIIPDK